MHWVPFLPPRPLICTKSAIDRGKLIGFKYPHDFVTKPINNYGADILRVYSHGKRAGGEHDFDVVVAE